MNCECEACTEDQANPPIDWINPIDWAYEMAAEACALDGLN